MTPEEREAEQRDPISLLPEELEELDGWLERSAGEAKQMYFQNERRRKKRR